MPGTVTRTEKVTTAPATGVAGETPVTVIGTPPVGGGPADLVDVPNVELAAGGGVPIVDEVVDGKLADVLVLMAGTTHSGGGGRVETHCAWFTTCDLAWL